MRKSPFSYIEILLSITIIGMLSATLLTIQRYRNNFDNEKRKFIKFMEFLQQRAIIDEVDVSVEISQNKERGFVDVQSSCYPDFGTLKIFEQKERFLISIFDYNTKTFPEKLSLQFSDKYFSRNVPKRFKIVDGNSIKWQRAYFSPFPSAQIYKHLKNVPKKEILYAQEKKKIHAY